MKTIYITDLRYTKFKWFKTRLHVDTLIMINWFFFFPISKNWRKFWGKLFSTLLNQDHPSFDSKCTDVREVVNRERTISRRSINVFLAGCSIGCIISQPSPLRSWLATDPMTSPARPLTDRSNDSIKHSCLWLTAIWRRLPASLRRLTKPATMFCFPSLSILSSIYLEIRHFFAWKRQNIFHLAVLNNYLSWNNFNIFLYENDLKIDVEFNCIWSWYK